jgi:hypothetical protein
VIYPTLKTEFCIAVPHDQPVHVVQVLVTNFIFWLEPAPSALEKFFFFQNGTSRNNETELLEKS